MSSPLVVAATGAGFGFSLIVAIGAQNTFVLRQGLRREHVGLVVATCAASDVVLIAAGVGGVGAILAGTPALLTGVRLAGALFLLTYAVMAARRAVRPGVLATSAGGPATPRRTTFLTALALTWLNPHVYLDTVLLLGSVAATHGDQRWAFGAGAALSSITWFAGLGRGAALLRPLFLRAVAWRVLDGSVAGVMATMGVVLLLSA